MDKAIFERLCERIDSYRDDVIDLQTRLTAIPALSPKQGGEGEVKKAKLLAGYLKEIGFTDKQIKEYRAPDPEAPCGYRPNLVARLPGSDSTRAVWIMAHMDVVPAGNLDDWSSDPWTVRVEGDRLYGRGVEDNQQGMVGSIMAVRALMEEKIVPPVDVALLLVADEETGNELGIGYLLDNEEVFGPDDLIVVPDGGLPDGSQIMVAEKAIMWIRFVLKGRQCHGSMPDKGINAHKAGAHLIVRLGDLYEIYEHHDPVFDPPTSTFEPTMKEANVPNINTIPGEDVFCMDCRIMPCYPLDEVKATVEGMCREIEEKLGVGISTEYPQFVHSAPSTPVDAPVVLALKEAVRGVYGVDAQPMGIGGGTVAAFIRKKGYNAAVWACMDETMHGPDEYCVIGNLLGDAKVFLHMIMSG